MAESFNLIDEPWIPVLLKGGGIQQISIREVFQQANEITGIACELATMQFAIFRILFAIFRRSCDDLLESDSKEGWKELWQSEELPLDLIDSYLNSVKDRFDLLHPTQPFMQTPGLRSAKGEWKELDILIADSPGGNSLFSQTDPQENLSYAQAARWLIHAHAFDYSGIKTGAVGDGRAKNGRGYPMGIGWSGWLGCTLIVGINIRETLILNYCGDFDFDDLDSDLPIWEEPPQTPEPNEKYRPHGQLSLITWPQRRILLRNNGREIDGVLICNGDPVAYTAQRINETMTSWRYSKPQSAKAKQIIYMPKALDPEVALWRGLSSLLPESAEKVKSVTTDKISEFLPPKTVVWLGEHIGDALPNGYLISLQVCSMLYGSQNAVFADVVVDKLTIPGALAVLKNHTSRAIVLSAVGRAENAAKIFANFAANIARASGCVGDVPGDIHQKAKARVYAQIDSLFRHWLQGLRLEEGELEEQLQDWTDQLRNLLLIEGQIIADEAPPTAWSGREETIGSTDQKRFYTLGLADAWFRNAINKELPMKRKEIAQ